MNRNRLPVWRITMLARRLHPVLVALLAIPAVLLCEPATAQGSPVVTEWVQQDPANDPFKLALGYPVPIPVDTPMPFDGFRTYAALRTRHLDLAATTPWVHEAAIGNTRQGRTIWAYRLGDADLTTRWGLPEAATLTNGGIHAREWQTPETVTGILELIATAPGDAWLYDYLRDSVNMVVIPVLNIDGFLQTQRYPNLNYLQTDPDFPANWPRDGRMRRKNMLNTDENFDSTFDHLNGVDLNRNNPAYWNSTNGNSSSSDVRSLVHHGATPQSEPETRALDTAAALGPVNRLRLYTDVHSYSMVHFWSRTDNERLTTQTERTLQTFTDHHRAFPAGKWYAYSGRSGINANEGIGTTAEHFTVNYQVPSWTLEIEPSAGQAFHAPLPGGGADYSGSSENSHDGFILPESEIRRVREQLAETFATVYYRQSGPPHIQSVRLFDSASGALVYASDWDPVDAQQRGLTEQQLQPLEVGRDYRLWLGFNKPMRWLDDGVIAPFPGQPASAAQTAITAVASGQRIDLELANDTFLLQPGAAPDGYTHYRTDAMVTNFRISDTAGNQELFTGGGMINLQVRSPDMTGLGLDTNPATVADWDDGHWVAYENSIGQEGDAGGTEENIVLQVTTAPQQDLFAVEPAISSAWFDPARRGEGFLIEVLPSQRAVLYWFTYDDAGEQDWFIAVGTVDGNRLRFPELLRVSGGIFGPGFDPDQVTREVVGSATFLWTECNLGSMDWHIGNRRGRQQLTRLSQIEGLGCGEDPGNPPVQDEARYSGSWFDPDRSGEGYVVQILVDNRALVYWFSYDPEGQRRWFYGTGTLQGGSWRFDEIYTTAGPVFGDGYNPDDFNLVPWGTLELDLSCEGGEARYTSTESGFGSGSVNIEQLTSLDGPACPQP